MDSFSSGDAATVVARARDANTWLTIGTPLGEQTGTQAPGGCAVGAYNPYRQVARALGVHLE